MAVLIVLFTAPNRALDSPLRMVRTMSSQRRPIFSPSPANRSMPHDAALPLQRSRSVRASSESYLRIMRSSSLSLYALHSLSWVLATHSTRARCAAVRSASFFEHVLLQCLFSRLSGVFPQCGLMVFPGIVIVSR